MGDEMDLEPEADEAEGAAESAGGAGRFVAGLIIGAVVGAGVALLLAPAPGRVTRNRLTRHARRLRRDAEREGGRAAKMLRTRGARLRRQLAQTADDLRERIDDAM